MGSGRLRKIELSDSEIIVEQKIMACTDVLQNNLSKNINNFKIKPRQRHEGRRKYQGKWLKSACSYGCLTEAKQKIKCETNSHGRKKV